MEHSKNKALIVATCVCIILLSVRIIDTGTMKYIFLAWNLTLAWVPYLVSRWLQKIKPGSKWKAGTLLLTWLLFLPNAPYIITDFIHLHHRPPVPLLFDLAMLFLFSVTGLALGLLSIQQTEYWWKQHRPYKVIAKLRMFIFLLCGFGIYLGRVERWNSWDILTDPDGLLLEIAGKLFHPISNIETWVTTVLFALLMWIPYTMIHSLSVTGRNTA